MKSPFQFQFAPDGSLTLDGSPHVQVQTIEEQGRVVGRNWQLELGLPKFQEEWEAMAKVRGMSLRGVRFILMDESASRLPGHPRLQPKTVTLPSVCPFELGHSGFVIGFVHAFITGFGPEFRALIPELFGIDIPPPLPEGDYIVGQARLFDSPLAASAWDGLQQGIFTHVCPMTFSHTEPVGEATLVQVTLTPGDYPGCPGARILTTWEG